MPDLPPILTRAALVLATSSHAEVRDGAKALEYAERATILTRNRDPNALTALAAACAETGQFDRAVAVINQAISAATSAGQPGLQPNLRAYLAAFAEHRPIRNPAW